MEHLTNSTQFTLRETAVLAEMPEEKVRREVDNKVIVPLKTRRGRAWRRVFSRNDIYYFCFISMAAGDVLFSPAARSKLYFEFKRFDFKSPVGHRVGHRFEVSEFFTVDYDRLLERIEPRIRLYVDGKSRIEEDPDILGGEPVFRGTRLSVRHIGEMVGNGADIADIREDYPYLTEDDVRFAELYTRAHPRLGRPRAGDR